MHPLFLEEVTIARLGHPLRTGEMAFVDDLGAFRLLGGVNAKDDRDGFRPVRAFGFSVEQAQIGHKMPFVIRRHALLPGRLGLEWRCRHAPITTSTRCDRVKDSTNSSIVAFPLLRLTECALPRLGQFEYYNT